MNKDMATKRNTIKFPETAATYASAVIRETYSRFLKYTGAIRKKTPFFFFAGTFFLTSRL
jgi:hypothetical protein